MKKLAFLLTVALISFEANAQKIKFIAEAPPTVVAGAAVSVAIHYQ